MGLTLPFRKRVAAGPELALPDHSAVSRADPYSFQVSHRRLAWMLRLSAATNIVLASALTVSMAAFSALFPLTRTEIALVRYHEPDDRLIRIEPIQADVPGFTLLMEWHARRFVRLLVEIDPATQDERLRQAFIYADTSVYRQFKEDRIDTGALQKALDSKLIRSVRIESSEQLPSLGKAQKWAVDFVQRDERAGQLVEERRIRALLVLATRPDTVKPEDRFENPLGIVVTDFVLKERF